MEAARFSEISANLYKTTRCQIADPVTMEFEIKLPSRIFGPNRDNVMGECGKMGSK
jgi:hypothetical protein